MLARLVDRCYDFSLLNVLRLEAQEPQETMLPFFACVVFDAEASPVVDASQNNSRHCNLGISWHKVGGKQYKRVQLFYSW